jgi:hypothetical protein
MRTISAMKIPTNPRKGPSEISLSALEVHFPSKDEEQLENGKRTSKTDNCSVKKSKADV